MTGWGPIARRRAARKIGSGLNALHQAQTSACIFASISRAVISSQPSMLISDDDHNVTIDIFSEHIIQAAVPAGEVKVW